MKPSSSASSPHHHSIASSRIAKYIFVLALLCLAVILILHNVRVSTSEMSEMKGVLHRGDKTSGKGDDRHRRRRDPDSGRDESDDPLFPSAPLPTDSLADATARRHDGERKRYADELKQHQERERKSSSSSVSAHARSTATHLVWNRSIYLPVHDPAVLAAFRTYEKKQQMRVAQASGSPLLWPRIKAGSQREKECFANTPECEFFRAVDPAQPFELLLDKCCEEHRKLKAALTRTFDVAQKAGLQLFLDSGTLLASLRDGGDTLVPWETDIDLGIVGAWPNKVDGAFAIFNAPAVDASNNRHHFLFETCKRKVSANKSRDGSCSDAFYVYYASNAAEAARDTSRVEIWPFREDGAALVHPTRKKLTVSRELVVPLSSTFTLTNAHDHKADAHPPGSLPVLNRQRQQECRIWGMPALCPAMAERYLDNEYGRTWRWPKTIHWGSNNAPSWNVREK